MAPLTSKQRNALPDSAFAGSDRSYPVDTPNRARNALARGSQNASPAIQSKIKSKVGRKFPNIAVQGLKDAQ